MLRAMLVTKQDQLLSRDHRKSGNWSSRTFGAKREGVARETEQLELRLEEPETDQARPDIQTARHRHCWRGHRTDRRSLRYRK
jgi:hypothetical protein